VRPTISIIIPVYNGERFLAEAIESAVAQSWPADEIVVVDDGSVDGSAAIAESYEVSLVSRPHSGLFATLNAGLRATTGEFVTFLDADDVMLPSKIGLQARYLLDHPEAGAVLCGQEIFIEDGATPPPWVAVALRGGVPPPPMSMMLRHGVIDRVGEFAEDLTISGDVDFLVRMRAQGLEIHRLENVLLRRRMHESNLTHDQSAANKELLRSIRGQLHSRRRAEAP
jgi:glycosyltransferase involved in cell wall biosynthesis